jgi:hypothetical protein
MGIRRFLQKYPGRFKLVHLKDVAKNLPTGFGPAPEDSSVPLGQGQIDWPKTLAAAVDTGVKYWYLEEESDTSHEGIRESIHYLRTVRFEVVPRDSGERNGYRPRQQETANPRSSPKLLRIVISVSALAAS